MAQSKNVSGAEGKRAARLGRLHQKAIHEEAAIEVGLAASKELELRARLQTTAVEAWRVLYDKKFFEAVHEAQRLHFEPNANTAKPRRVEAVLKEAAGTLVELAEKIRSADLFDRLQRFAPGNDSAQEALDLIRLALEGDVEFIADRLAELLQMDGVTLTDVCGSLEALQFTFLPEPQLRPLNPASDSSQSKSDVKTGSERKPATSISKKKAGGRLPLERSRNPAKRAKARLYALIENRKALWKSSNIDLLNRLRDDTEVKQAATEAQVQINFKLLEAAYSHGRRQATRTKPTK